MFVLLTNHELREDGKLEPVQTMLVPAHIIDSVVTPDTLWEYPPDGEPFENEPYLWVNLTKPVPSDSSECWIIRERGTMEEFIQRLEKMGRLGL